MINRILSISKKVGVIAAIFLVPLTIAADDGRYYCHLDYTEGEVLIQRANEAEVTEAVRNMPIMAGDRLWTEMSGRAELQFPDGSIMSMNYETKVDFEAIGEPIGGHSDNTVLKLWSGTIFFTIFHDRDRDQNLQVETMAGYISILNRGSYRIHVDEGYGLRIMVYEGLAEVGNNEGTSMVRSGQRLFLEPGDMPSEPMDFVDYTYDDFREWVENRRVSHDDNKSAYYVDDTLDYLVDDMDDYGDWHYVDVYETYVWVPHTRYVHVGWRPYNYGHWVWTPHGWSFVSYDPWGWVTYRYGRWDWSPWGWCWIPGYYYSPSWVYWEIGHNYIGWTPLGYYNWPASRYAYKEYPRKYKPRYGNNGQHPGATPHGLGGKVKINPNSWTVVSKEKFTKRQIHKHALKENELNKLNRSGAKAIKPEFKQNGFTDRKLTNVTSKTTLKRATYKDLPSGVLKQSSRDSYYSSAKRKSTDRYPQKITTDKYRSNYDYLKSRRSKDSSKTIKNYRKKSSDSKYRSTTPKKNYQSKSPTKRSFKSTKSGSKSSSNSKKSSPAKKKNDNYSFLTKDINTNLRSKSSSSARVYRSPKHYSSTSSYKKNYTKKSSSSRNNYTNSRSNSKYSSYYTKPSTSKKSYSRNNSSSHSSNLYSKYKKSYSKPKYYSSSSSSKARSYYRSSSRSSSPKLHSSSPGRKSYSTKSYSSSSSNIKKSTPKSRYNSIVRKSTPKSSYRSSSVKRSAPKSSYISSGSRKSSPSISRSSYSKSRPSSSSSSSRSSSRSSSSSSKAKRK